MDKTLKSASLMITIKDQKPVITREIEFANGDTINFKLTLDSNPDAKVSDLHPASVEELISRLQAWIKL